MKKNTIKHIGSLEAVTDIILESLRDIKEEDQESDDFCIEAIKLVDELKAHFNSIGED